MIVMPRKTRMYLPNIPAHVVQRGNNRNACFFCEDDFQYYKEVLGEGLRRYQVSLNAYCLMTNHVHLLMTPVDETGISKVLQHIGRLYVAYINKTYRRSGTLWEGRHKSSLIDDEHYLLACYRYIELNPVTASMVEKPEEYAWSSYHHNAVGKPDAIVTPHRCYMELASEPALRLERYRELFRHHLSAYDIHEIRRCLSANQVLGKSHFKAQVETALGRSLGYPQRGRPKGVRENGID